MISDGKIFALAGLLFIAASLVSPLIAAAQDGPALLSEARAAARASAESLDLQTEMPGYPADARTGRGGRGGAPESPLPGGSGDSSYPPESWDEGYPSESWSDDYFTDKLRDRNAPPEGRGENYGRRGEGDFSFGWSLAFIARIILWASVAVIVVVIAQALHEHLRKTSRSRRLERNETPEAESGGGSAEAPVRMDKARHEADDLARQGLFVEAMHVLLLRSVNEMRRRLDVSIAASLTSREILSRVGLSPEGRRLFADIIGRVEISYFGFHQPGADEYAACRRSFEELTGAMRREAER